MDPLSRSLSSWFVEREAAVGENFALVVHGERDCVVLGAIRKRLSPKKTFLGSLLWNPLPPPQNAPWGLIFADRNEQRPEPPLLPAMPQWSMGTVQKNKHGIKHIIVPQLRFLHNSVHPYQILPENLKHGPAFIFIYTWALVFTNRQEHPLLPTHPQETKNRYKIKQKIISCLN